MSDLNRRIVEALGYIVVLFKGISREPVTLMYLRGEDEDAGVPLPDYEHSLDAITAEIERAGYRWMVKSAYGFHAEVYFWKDATFAMVDSDADTAPVALGEAFLRALAAKEVQHD